MKNIKKLLMIFIIIGILFIVNVKASTSKIEITNVSVEDKSGTITLDEPTFESNKITSNIIFNQKDDFVTFELTLKNVDDGHKYKVKSIDDNNTNKNISIEYGYNDGYISKNETTKVTIKLKYDKQLVNVDNISLNDLTININLVSENGNNSSIVINPSTRDNLICYIVILIVSLTGIILIITKKKIKGLKIGSILLIFGLAISSFIVFASETLSIPIKFISIDIKGKFETYNVAIDSKDGSDQVVKSITYGQAIGELPSDPSKVGYTFDKWVDQNGNTITPETIITGPTEIIAKYNIIDYTINYNLNDGSLPQNKTNPTSYNIESNNITLENPSKPGYTFSGWTGTGLDSLITNVTILSGSTGDRNYTANYSPNQSTKYTVIHKYQNYDLTTYTEDKEILTGPTDETVTPEFKSSNGFNNPESTQSVKIKGDGTAEVTYIYTRKNFNFEITDRTYIDETVTAQNNSYLYETQLTLKAIERPGYTFEWSDGNTNLERTINLNDNISLSTIYTAKTNTKYRVEHYKMNFAEGDYTLADYENLTGKTDSPITPEVNTYTGFISPNTQTTTIDGNGSTVVKYYYKRKKVTVTINHSENIVEGDKSGKYYYGEKITLTAKEIDNYTFNKWSNNVTSNPITITVGEENIEIEPIYTKIQVTVSFDTDGGSSVAPQTININGKATRPSSKPTKTGFKFRNWYTDKNHQTLFDFNNTTISTDTTIYAYYVEDEFSTVFSQSGECTFNGAEGVITGDNCSYADGVNKYIDTGINLYNIENHEKDYEIGFTIVNYNPSLQSGQTTLMNTKLEGGSYPGLVFRKRDTDNKFDLSSRKTSSTNVRLYFGYENLEKVKIYRIYNEETEIQEIFYSINGGNKTKINDLSEFNPVFDLSVWFGAAPVDTTAQTAQRHLIGTLKDMYIKVGTFKEN